MPKRKMTLDPELAAEARRGGTVFAAELILSSPLPPEARASESNWFA